MEMADEGMYKAPIFLHFLTIYRFKPLGPLATFTQTFFNDARRGANGRLRVDECLAELRAQVNHPRGKKAKSTTQGNSRNFPGPLAAVPEPQAQPPPPRQPREPRTALPFSLASAQAFLAHVNPNDPRLPQRRPSVTASVISRPTESNANVRTEKQEPSAPVSNFPVQQNNTIVSLAVKPSSPAPIALLPSEETVSRPLTELQQPSKSRGEATQLLSTQKLSKGLAGSRYANDPTSAQAAPVFQQAIRPNNNNENPFKTVQNAGLSASKWAGTTSHVVKRENLVTIRCNYKDEQCGTARLFKQIASEKSYTFELEVNGNVLVHALINVDVRFELTERVVTYQAQGEGSPIWQIIFTMPYMAVNFYNTARPESILAKPDPTKIVGQAQPGGLSVAAQVHSGLSAPNTAIQSTSNQLAPTTLQPSSMSPVSTSTSAASSEPEASVFSTVPSNEHVEQLKSIVSDDFPQPASEQQDELLFDFSASSPRPESPLEATGSRISCQVYSQMTELAGVDQLISFSDHDDDEGNEESQAAPQTRPPTIEELLLDMQKKDDNEEIRAILAKLDNRPEGTFLQQVSAIVVANGGLPANELSKEQLLSSLTWSRLYNVAAENVVSDFLSGSEIFKELPDLVSLLWVGDKSRKVLALAIDHEHRTDSIMTTHPSREFLAADHNHGTDLVIDTGLAPNDVIVASDPSHSALATDHNHDTDTIPTAGLTHSALTIDHDHRTDAIMTTHPSRNALDIDNKYGTDTIMTTGLDQDALPGSLDMVVTSQNALALDPGDNTNTVVTDSASQDAQPDAIERSRIVISIDELLKLRRGACEVKVKLIDDTDLKFRPEPPITHDMKPPAARSTVSSRVKSSSATGPRIHGAPTVSHIPQMIAPKWQNAVAQKTDMRAWDSILNNDRKLKSTSIRSIFDESKGNIQTSRPRINGHVPTNSDCDRLAQKLEGWHMDLDSTNQQLPMKLESSETVGDVRNMTCGPIDVEVAPPASPLSSTRKASTSASQSMTEKLTTALKSPLTFSPRPLTTLETADTRLQAIEGQINPVAIKNEEAATLDRCDLPQDSRTSQGSLPPVHTGYAVQTMPVLPDDGQATKAQVTFVPAPSSTGTVSGTPVSSTVSRATAANGTPSLVAVVNLVSDSGAAVMSPTIEKFRKGPGLSASRWATDDNEFAPQQSFSQSATGSSRRLNGAHAPVFQPTAPPSQSYLNLTESRPNLVPLATVTSRPMIPAESEYVPLMATIITRDPYTGELREVEGMLKAGSVPVVPHVPLPLGGPPRNQENVPMQTVLSAGFYNSSLPNFPPHPEQARYSSGSSDSDSHFKPGTGSSPLSPPARGQHGRIALSPVQNRANDIQSELQSRLNSSLAGRHGGNSPAR
jgi:hypothetical protein